jgi:hypothetical protein
MLKRWESDARVPPAREPRRAGSCKVRVRTTDGFSNGGHAAAVGAGDEMNGPRVEPRGELGEILGEAFTFIRPGVGREISLGEGDEPISFGGKDFEVGRTPLAPSVGRPRQPAG